MSNYGPVDTLFSFDDSGGTPQDVTPYIRTINGFDVEAVMEETTTFGKAWKESKATGVRMVGDIVLGGDYENTPSTGPHALFKDVCAGPSDPTRTFKVTYGGTDASEVETNIKKYSRKPQSKALTKFEVTLEPTGAVTES